MDARARRVRAQRNRRRLPPRRRSFRWARRIAGLLATAAFLGAGFAILQMILPDGGGQESVAATPTTTPEAKQSTKKKAKKKPTKPKGPTKAQLAARKDAIAVVRAKGFTTLKQSDYDPKATLRVLIGRPVGDAAGGQRAFFFNQSTFIGNDALAPSSRLRVSKQGKVTVTLSYGVYEPNDAVGDPSGRKRVRFRLAGWDADAAGHDPTGFRPVPATAVGSDLRVEEESMEPSYASGTSSTPLLGDTIGDNLDRTIERFPDREALVSVHQDLRYTYAQFGEAVDRAARAFIAAGIEPGDRVGIWSPNCAEWALVQYATAKAGIILVNINPAYRTSELEYVLRQSGCRMLVAATAFKTSDYVQMVDDVRPNLDGLEQVVFIGRDWEQFIAGGERVSPQELAERQRATEFDDPINIQYTSGTTGFPKGATLSHHNILNNGYFVGAGCGYTPEDRVCIPVPYYHCFGMVMGNLACTSHGACMVIPAPAFDPVATLQAVQDEACTSLYGVPTMFIAELEHPEFGEFDLSSLRTGIMAGSPCPIETMRRVVDRMHMEEVTICYGMTETSPVSTQTGADDPLEKRVGTVGRVHPHVEVKIVDPESGAVVPRETPGELCTRAYSVMLGYWEEPEKTADAIDRARWMHTGDLAQMDDGGLHQDRRAHQGHGHPRRRERLPARDRGVPDGAPRRPGRAGHRGPGPALRRGADGLGRHARRRAARP